MKGGAEMFLVGVIVGAMFIGSPVGFCVAAFCQAAKNADKQMEMAYQEKKK